MRIATFNLENLDFAQSENDLTLDDRIPSLRRTLSRLDADIICLQEIHSQDVNGERHLAALDQLTEGTKYSGYSRAHTVTTDGNLYSQRNLVILSAYEIDVIAQYRNDRIDELKYRKITSTDPSDVEPDAVRWERPILHAQVSVPEIGLVHVINLHLKSKIASNIPGQRDGYSWRSAAGWAEGFFLSSIKRVGQALETRVLIDSIFDEDPNANILVCGDFNAEPGQVPVQAICGAIEDTNNPNLRSRSLIPASHDVPQSLRYTLFHHGQGNLLDHMVFSQPLFGRFRQAQILNENLHDESLPFRYDLKFPESDHAAFVCEFV